MRETIEGHVVDLACLRRYPRAEVSERAARHTTACALMGHCVESGYGVVEPGGRITPLDDAATPHVVDALWRSGRDVGVRLRISRQREGEEMRTEKVEVL